MFAATSAARVSAMVQGQRDYEWLLPQRRIADQADSLRQFES